MPQCSCTLACLAAASLLAAVEPLADERLATSFLPTVVAGAVGGAVAWYEPDTAPEPWRHRLAWLEHRPRPILDGRAGAIAMWFRHDAPAFFYESLIAVRGDGDGVARPGDGDRQGLAISLSPPDSTGWSDGDPTHFRRGRVVAEFFGADGRGGALVGPDVAVGVWTHVVLCWDASRVALHVDGRLAGERANPSLPDLDAVERLWLGVNQLGACSFAGSLDQVQAWDRPLAATEIAQLAARGALPDDGHLVLDLPFDQGGEARVRRHAARHPARERLAVALPGDGRGGFVLGAPVPVTVAVPPGSGSWQVRASVAALAAPGTVLAERSATLAALPDRPAELVLDLAPGRCGAHRITVECGNGGAPQRSVLDVAVTVPPPPASPASLLGDHLEMREWRGAGAGWTRIWQYEVGWQRCEPRPGVFFWEHLDRQVAEAAAAGRSILLCAHFTPAWASTAPPVAELEAELRRHGLSAARAQREAPGHRCLYPPRDQADFRRYCAALFARYRGRIAAYELLNEPNSPEWHGTAAQYAAQLATMRAVAREVDPAALVVGGSGCPGYREWSERIAEAGAAPSLDVLSVHDYQYQHPVRWLRQGLIASAAGSMAKRGHTVPVWDTESAFPTAPRVAGLPMDDAGYFRHYGEQGKAGGVVVHTEARGARREVMARLTTLAGGAARTFIHACSAIQDNRYRQPATDKQVAWTRLAAALAGATRVEALDAGGDGVLVVAVHGPAGRTLALMAEQDGSLPLAWPDGVPVAASDVFGNPLALQARDGVLVAPVGDSVLWLERVPAEARPLRLMELAGSGTLAAGTPLRLELRLRNPAARPLTVALAPLCPGTAVRAEPASLVLAPGAAATAALVIDPGAQPRRGDRRLTVAAQVEGTAWSLAERELWCPGLETRLPRLAAEPAAGADAAAWRAAGALAGTIDGGGEQVVVGRPNPMFPDRGGCWRGPADSSATLLAGWTPAALHLRLAVRDDVLVATPAGRESSAWGWDAAEVFVDLREPAARQGPALRRSTGTAQVFVCAPAGPAWEPVRTSTPRAGTVTVAGRARRVEGGWEAELRLAPVAGTLASGRPLGLDVALDDADQAGDQPARISQLVWQGGEANYRDPGLWGGFVLAGE
jgi:hypothetical protein